LTKFSHGERSRLAAINHSGDGRLQKRRKRMVVERKGNEHNRLITYEKGAEEARSGK